MDTPLLLSHRPSSPSHSRTRSTPETHDETRSLPHTRARYLSRPTSECRFPRAPAGRRTVRRNAKKVVFREGLPFHRSAVAREVLPPRGSVAIHMRARTSNAHTPLSTIVFTHGPLTATRQLHFPLIRLVAHSPVMLMNNGQGNKQIQHPLILYRVFRVVCQPSRERCQLAERKNPTLHV